MPLVPAICDVYRPANYVFCRYALQESMRRGTITSLEADQAHNCLASQEHTTLQDATAKLQLHPPSSIRRSRMPVVAALPSCARSAKSINAPVHCFL